MSRARALRARPRRREDEEVRWELAEGERAAVIYPKHFGRFEGWLHKRIGGPDEIRRPLNRHTRLICLLCDGDHSVADIVQAVDDEYGEDIAPAGERVRLFLERLLDLHLLTLESPDSESAGEDPDGEGDDEMRAAHEASAALEAACE